MKTHEKNIESFHRKTCRRYNDAGHAHALTFSCFQRKPFLSSNRTRSWMIQSINSARTKHRFDVWAYVIMPEHVHLLIYPTGKYSISRILTTIKQSVSKRAILFVKNEAPDFLNQMMDVQPGGKRHIRFWQRGGGYDRNLWSEKYIYETIDYIHHNPVRRELCESDMDWIWSSARAYTGLQGSPLSINFDSLPDDPRRE